jgi:hypothetical protein
MRVLHCLTHSLAHSLAQKWTHHSLSSITPLAPLTHVYFCRYVGHTNFVTSVCFFPPVERPSSPGTLSSSEAKASQLSTQLLRCCWRWWCCCRCYCCCSCVCSCAVWACVCGCGWVWVFVWVGVRVLFPCVFAALCCGGYHARVLDADTARLHGQQHQSHIFTHDDGDDDTDSRATLHCWTAAAAPAGSAKWTRKPRAVRGLRAVRFLPPS